MFYGWRIVGVSAAAQSLAVGTTFFSYGVFVKPLATEFEAPRLAVVLGLTLLMLVQGLVSPSLGRLLDVRSPRSVMASGVLLCAAGFAGLAFATSLWQVGILFGSAIAVGSHMFGPLATSTLVANWFVAKRGQALGVTAVGASVGGLVVPVLATRLMEDVGWRGAVLAFAGALALFALPLWLGVVDRPEQIGARPDGDDAHGATVNAEEPGVLVEESSAKSLLKSHNFWVITVAIGLVFSPTSTMIAHLVPYATDLGFSPQRAALLMSAYSGAGALGRLSIGALADRVDKRVACWGVLVILASAWIAFLLTPSYVGLVFASLGLGFGVGGIMPLWGALTGACFGRAVFGRAMGLMTPLMLPFNLAGAPIAAYVFDRTGSYTGVLSAFLVAFLACAIVVSLLRVPRVEPGH